MRGNKLQNVLSFLLRVRFRFSGHFLSTCYLALLLYFFVYLLWHAPFPLASCQGCLPRSNGGRFKSRWLQVSNRDGIGRNCRFRCSICIRAETGKKVTLFIARTRGFCCPRQQICGAVIAFYLPLALLNSVGVSADQTSESNRFRFRSTFCEAFLLEREFIR